VTEDLHTSTTAAPSPVVTPADAGPGRPAGSAAASGSASGPQQAVASAQQAVQGAAEKPEVLVGAAFAGGFVFAFLLKRIGRG
jgi:hypothetical protein